MNVWMDIIPTSCPKDRRGNLKDESFDINKLTKNSTSDGSSIGGDAEVSCYLAS